MFVDDEIMILKGLKRAFFRKKWQLYFADSGDKALKILQNQPMDFIVSDMRMPGMNGADFLTEVANLYPQTVRIILSGYSDEEAAKRASFVAHQWFSKPCKPELLAYTIDHIECVRDSLPDLAVRQNVGKIKSLPSPPAVYMRLNALLNDEAVDMQTISEAISNEPALVAKLLQLTNSSFFSNGNQVKSLTEAITRLGVDIVCSITLAAETYSQLEEVPGFSLEEEQNHCLSTARLAATLVEPSLKQETILAGLLHNIGKSILYIISPQAMDTYSKKRVVGADNLELEQELFSADHTQLAGYLLHLWNFSYKLIEHIVLHHQPLKLIEKEFGSGAAVYVASRLLRKQDIDEGFIEHFDLADKMKAWQLKALDFS